MRCVVQRVKSANIVIDGTFSGNMNRGLVVLCAFCDSDDSATIDFCVDKIANLRIFSDADDKLNLSALDIGANVMIVSNFTVYGDTRKGRRPSFDKSAKGEISKPMYDETVAKFKKLFPDMLTGRFGADMQVTIENDGPVTIIVEKENV